YLFLFFLSLFLFFFFFSLLFSKFFSSFFFFNRLSFFLPTSLLDLIGLNMYLFVTVPCHFDSLLLVSANHFCKPICKGFSFGAILLLHGFLQLVSANVPTSLLLPGYARILRAGHATPAAFAESEALTCQAGPAGSVRTQ